MKPHRLSEFVLASLMAGLLQAGDGMVARGATRDSQERTFPGRPGDFLKGNIKAETAGGEFRFGRIDGTIRAQTAGGSISLSRATGPVTLRTAGGRISIGEARAGVQAQTAGGSISAALAAQPEGDCRLSTSGGRIEVELASDLELDITAQTSGGRVEVDVPLSAVESRSRSWLRAKMNGGGPTLSLQTSGGSITLKKL
jgi:DUF4097 and DUF4098 domain-containing protein YvlB